MGSVAKGSKYRVTLDIEVTTEGGVQPSSVLAIIDSVMRQQKKFPDSWVLRKQSIKQLK
jgi:hypothetical protein